MPYASDDFRPLHGSSPFNPRAVGPLYALVISFGLAAAPLAAQVGPGEVAARCGPFPEAPEAQECYRVALALQAARAGVGLASAGGATLPGTNATLGTRTLGAVPHVPRVAVVVRGGVTRAPFYHSDVGSETTTIRALRAEVGLGLFDGFRVVPSVGRILSVDVTVDGSWLDLPSGGDEFCCPSSVKGFGVGVRVGLVGESPSLPGVTVSAGRRWLGDTHADFADDPFEFGNAGSSFETVVTSVRGTVGRDFLAWGFLGGVGWDRYEGDAELLVPGSGQFEANDVRSERLLFFGGLSFDVLILELSGEAGWARGFDDDRPRRGDFDPSDSTFWASLGLGLRV